ncbi:MAG: hypothetical protein ACYS80_23875 [Planctomycetota bacterium]|jgi:hypothetical protein
MEQKADFAHHVSRHGNLSSSPGNPDLYKVQKAVWGELGYPPSP